jgi:Zn-dependent peptidase ImmA (M78 family)
MDVKQQEIYNKYKNEFPFKIVEFINELGITVTTGELPSYISGAIRKENNIYRIYVNSAHSVTRLRFTLAHELGHFFYDKNYLDSNEIIDPSKQAQSKFLFRKKISADDHEMRQMDIQANQFAAELLMPLERFVEIWHQKTSPREVADYFKVSEAAIMIRASNLLGEIF